MGDGNVPTAKGHALFTTVDAMLSRTAFAARTGRQVVAVRVRPFDGAAGVSGSTLATVGVTDGQGAVLRFVLKRTSARRD